LDITHAMLLQRLVAIHQLPEHAAETMELTYTDEDGDEITLGKADDEIQAAFLCAEQMKRALRFKMVPRSTAAAAASVGDSGEDTTGEVNEVVLKHGDRALYIRTGEEVEILRVHSEVETPFYTVRMQNGNERQTTVSHLKHVGPATRERLVPRLDLSSVVIKTPREAEERVSRLLADENEEEAGEGLTRSFIDSVAPLVTELASPNEDAAERDSMRSEDDKADDKAVLEELAEFESILDTARALKMTPRTAEQPDTKHAAVDETDEEMNLSKLGAPLADTAEPDEDCGFASAMASALGRALSWKMDDSPLRHASVPPPAPVEVSPVESSLCDSISQLSETACPVEMRGALRELDAMGFDRIKSSSALMACDGDAMRAVDYLLQESNHQEHDAPPPPVEPLLEAPLEAPVAQNMEQVVKPSPTIAAESVGISKHHSRVFSGTPLTAVFRIRNSGRTAWPDTLQLCPGQVVVEASNQAPEQRYDAFKNDVQLPVVCASSAVPKLHPGEVANVTVELHTGSLTKGSSCSVEYSLHNPDVKDMAQSCVAVKGGPLRVTLVVASSHATTSYGSGTTTTTSASYGTGAATSTESYGSGAISPKSSYSATTSDASGSYVATDVADIAYAASSSGGNSSYVAASAASAAAGSCSMEGTLYATTNATTAQYASTAETTGPYAAATGGTPKHKPRAKPTLDFSYQNCYRTSDLVASTVKAMDYDARKKQDPYSRIIIELAEVGFTDQRAVREALLITKGCFNQTVKLLMHRERLTHAWKPQWESVLVDAAEMGFDDFWGVKEAIIETGGDLNSAVRLLVAHERAARKLKTA